MASQAAQRQWVQVQPLVVFRVKRKRTDEPVEELLVTESVVERPRKRINVNMLADKLSQMYHGAGDDSGTSKRTKRRRDEDMDEDDGDQTYTFTRLKATPGTAAAATSGSGSSLALADQLVAAGLTADSACSAAKTANGVSANNASATTMAANESLYGRPTAKRARTKVSVIDIVPEEWDNDSNNYASANLSSYSASTPTSSVSTTSAPSSSSSSSSSSASSSSTNKTTAIAILTPFEEIMDKAIYDAFVKGASCCAGLLPAILRGGPINFQRKLAANTTALMAAAHWKQTEIVKRLLERGAIKSLCDSHGRTALDFAIQQGHGPTIEVLSNNSDENDCKGRGNGDSGDIMDIEPSPNSDEVYDYFVMSSGPGRTRSTTPETESDGGAKTTSSSASAMAPGAFPSGAGAGAGAGVEQVSCQGHRAKGTKSARAHIKSFHVSLFGGIGVNQDDQSLRDSDDEHNRDHLEWGLGGDCYDDEYAEEALEDENHEGYVANEYPDEELLTSDDECMHSDEGSSAEDEDYW